MYNEPREEYDALKENERKYEELMERMVRQVEEEIEKLKAEIETL